MNVHQSPDVIAFRVQRMRKAPRNWCYWVAGFTVANGILTLVQPDVLILAGLVVPFAAQTIWAHFVAAAALGAVGYFGPSNRSLFAIALVGYVLDTVLRHTFSYGLEC